MQALDERNKDLTHLNQHLAQLNVVFNRIENYDANLNVGFRSIKSIGAWLLFYKLSDLKTQRNILSKLALSMSTKEMAIFIQSLDYLTNVDCIKEIINQYQKAGGVFKIEVATEIVEQTKIACNTIDDSGYLASLVKSNIILPKYSLTFTMENQVNFFWAGKFSSHSCKESRKTVNNKSVPYLTAKDDSQQFRYQLINHDHQYFHLVEFDTVEKQNSNHNYFNNFGSKAFFIEPIAKSGSHYLSSHYFNILNLASTSKFSKEEYDKLKQIKQKFFLNNIAIREALSEKNTTSTNYRFYFTFHFPKLAKPLTTTENRSGIYSVFENTDIANIHNIQVNYKSTRELGYDEQVNVIHTQDDSSASNTSTLRENKDETIHNIYIEYTLSNDFMFVYNTNNEFDLYPFFISASESNLVNDLTGVYSPHEGDVVPLKALKVSTNKNGLFSNNSDNALNDDDGCRVPCWIQ